jgi:hypothetical protein
MERHEKEQALKLHECLDYIGLRAQATSVGLLQLCAELVSAGVLDDDALDRIKSAIQHDITVSRPRKHGQIEFETVLRKRLDCVFPRMGDATVRVRMGTTCDMKATLEGVELAAIAN